MSNPSVRDTWLLQLLGKRLSEKDLERVAQNALGRSVWEAATDADLLSDDDIAHIVAEWAQVPLAKALFVSPQASRAFPERLARQFCVVPLSVTDSCVEIATANPFDFDCERTLAFATGRCIRMSVASPRRIADKIDLLYSPAQRVAELVMESHGPDRGRDIDSANIEEPDDGVERPVVNLVDHILREGITNGASDIHLEHGEGGISVRYRVDGILREAMVLPRAVGVPLVSRIKIMGQLDIADRLRPQGGRARFPVGKEVVDVRISTLPAAHGEKVVIRILDPRKSRQSLDALGLGNEEEAALQRLLEVREGLILVTGPTGSGKTTTLYAALRQLKERGVNIITVEDPVEYRIPGIVQVQINEKAGLTFASALRSILRQDPDVVLIGEIRDRETAAMAIQASLTGHLVFATLHTIDACSSIVRLTDLGVDAAKLGTALKGVVAQRLLRRLCKRCRVVAPGGVPDRLTTLVPSGSMVQMPLGCTECRQSGFDGRTTAMEVVLTNPDMEHTISNGEGHEKLVQLARTSGARSLWESGVSQMLAGETSPDELLRVLEPEGAAPEMQLSDDDSLPVPCFDDIKVNTDQSTYDSLDEILNGFDRMTKILPGVVDVYVIRLTDGEPRVLVLQRAHNTRCPGAWETVHGNLNPAERPEDGAVRELREETGLSPDRLYNVTVQPFYLHTIGTVQLAIVFAAFVSEFNVILGEEHQQFEWLSVPDAMQRFAWPREREALSQILQLIPGGDAGAVDDVLRVPLKS
ncbi:MAG: Flp pilus assembly complex ATPase component TadA [Gemmatimonadaceae bacterium]|nr:Flp pilus assembly complex ATPase component TadA [Gemmatimonadaceae bacterium]